MGISAMPGMSISRKALLDYRNTWGSVVFHGVTKAVWGKMMGFFLWQGLVWRVLCYLFRLEWALHRFTAAMSLSFPKFHKSL